MIIQLDYVSNGLKPPTRWYHIYIYTVYTLCIYICIYVIQHHVHSFWFFGLPIFARFPNCRPWHRGGRRPVMGKMCGVWWRAWGRRWRDSVGGFAWCWRVCVLPLRCIRIYLIYDTCDDLTHCSLVSWTCFVLWMCFLSFLNGVSPFWGSMFEGDLFQDQIRCILYIYPNLLNPRNFSGSNANPGFTRDLGENPGFFQQIVGL